MGTGSAFPLTAARLRVGREARGLSVEQAAAEAGVASAVWAAWEAGGAAPVDSAAELAAVCRVLRVDAAWLLGVTDRRGPMVTGRTGWATMTGVVATARLVPREGTAVPHLPAIRLGPVRLRRNAIEIGWHLRHEADPADLREVYVEPAGAAEAGAAVAAVVDRHPAPDDGPSGPLGRLIPPTRGVFRLPLPAFDPPWTVRGLGPDGPWREELRVDGTVLADYRRAAPAAEPRPAAEHAGVCIRLDRVACLPDRLAVFYEWEARPPAADIHVSAPRLLRAGDQPEPHHGAPATALPLRLPQLDADVAYFSPVAPGSEVVVEFPGVHRSERVPCDVRLPVPAAVPAELGLVRGLPDGYAASVVYWSHGLVLDLEGPHFAGFISPELETEGGEPVPLRGATGGGGRSVAVTGELPAGTQAVHLRALRVQRNLQGPWVLSFRVPGA